MRPMYLHIFADVFYIFINQIMAFKKGEKRPESSGRKKGTPNKVTHNTRQIVGKIIDDYLDSEQFLRDFKELEPRDRANLVVRLMPYRISSFQSVEFVDNTGNKETVSDKLKNLSGE